MSSLYKVFSKNASTYSQFFIFRIPADLSLSSTACDEVVLIGIACEAIPTPSSFLSSTTHTDKGVNF